MPKISALETSSMPGSACIDMGIYSLPPFPSSACNAVSRIPIELDIDSLPALPSTTRIELVALDMLPTLPEQTQDEIEELLQESPDTWEDDWALIIPPFPTYGTYTGKVKYYVPSSNGELVIQALGHEVTRKSIHDSLKWFYCLQKRLNENMDLLRKYGELGLSATPSDADFKAAQLTPLEQAQSAFAINHIAISENLNAVHGGPDLSFRLPMNCRYRDTRNFFAHDFGTPKANTNPVRNMGTEVKGKMALYAPLLLQVSTNIEVLEKQLADGDNWKPEVFEPTHSNELQYSCPDAADGMTYEPQAQDEYIQEQNEESEGDKRRCCCVYPCRPLKFCFRSAIFRRMAEDVEDWLQDMRFEAENRRAVWDETAWANDDNEGGRADE